jgi:hypothetical protein
MITAPAKTWSAYWCQKADTPRDEWEDGCGYSPSTGWFAVADGASSGTRSREWAFHLTRAFIEAGKAKRFNGAPTTDRFVEWVTDARTTFDSDSPEFRTFDVPAWIHVASSKKGAFATFLGGHVLADQWHVVAVGDCCLFHVSAEDTLMTTFPLAPGHNASDAPMLVTSVVFDDRQLGAHTSVANGAFAPGDCLFVTSDALAAWLLSQADQRATWAALRSIGARGFERLCRDLRATELLKNDDVTMLRIVNEGGRNGKAY